MVTTSWKCPECETVNDGEAELCVVCGGARAAAVPELAPAPLPIKTELGYVTPYTSTAVAENALALHALRKKLRLVCVIAAVLIVAACSWGVVLYNRNLQLSDRLSASVMQVDTLEEQCETLTADCEAKDKEIAKQNSTISSLRSENSKLESNLSDWSSFKSKTVGSNLGYGSWRFHMNMGVVVMNSSASSRTLTLTCSFGTHVTVNRSTSGSSASLNFDQSSWSGSTTTMTLRPRSKGITYFTFTNSVDYTSFVVVAIVI